MPLRRGKSKETISANISELHRGKTFAKTKKKFGKAKAQAQAIAIAMRQAGKSRPARPVRKRKKYSRGTIISAKERNL